MCKKGSDRADSALLRFFLDPPCAFSPRFCSPSKIFQTWPPTVKAKPKFHKLTQCCKTRGIWVVFVWRIKVPIVFKKTSKPCFVFWGDFQVKREKQDKPKSNHPNHIYRQVLLDMLTMLSYLILAYTQNLDLYTEYQFKLYFKSASFMLGRKRPPQICCYLSFKLK